MKIQRLDHLVLTVASIEKSCSFYEEVLGVEVVHFGKGRTALAFGHQKINLHEKGKEFEPKAAAPTAGSGDLCFIMDTPIPFVMEHLAFLQIPIAQGPVKRTGAEGELESVYIRDPDGNLLELSTY